MVTDLRRGFIPPGIHQVHVDGGGGGGRRGGFMLDVLENKPISQAGVALPSDS